MWISDSDRAEAACLGWAHGGTGGAGPTAWPTARPQMTTGVTTGVTTMLANAAGPVSTMYLLAMRLPKWEFVGTGAWFFLIVNVFKVPFSYDLGLISGVSLGRNAILFPAILCGVALGRFLLSRISQKLFENLLLAFSALAALRLIFA